MSTWDEKYVMLAVGMPLYWASVMFGHFVKVYYAIGAAKNMDEVVGEPRKYFEDFATRNKSPAAGYVRRGMAAHQNGWEAFILYLSAVFTAFAAQISPSSFNTHCVVAICLRFLFNILYVNGSPSAAKLRSLSFFAHVFTCFSLHYQAYLALVA